MNKEELIKKEDQLAHNTGPDRIVPSTELIKELENQPENPVRAKTGFKYLDSLITPIKGGELITITGLQKRGKTLWIKSLLQNFGKDGVKAVVFQYESPYREYFKNWGENPPLFYLPLQLRDKTSKWIKDRILEAILRYEISVVVIDPINDLICYELANSSTTQINYLVRFLKDICLEYNITIFVLAHAHRIERGGRLDENMVRESQILASTSDRLWIVDRVVDKQTKEFTADTQLIISLERESGFAMGKKVMFTYKDGLLCEKDLLGEPETQPQEDTQDELPF